MVRTVCTHGVYIVRNYQWSRYTNSANIMRNTVILMVLIWCANGAYIVCCLCEKNAFSQYIFLDLRFVTN